MWKNLRKIQITLNHLKADEALPVIQMLPNPDEGKCDGNLGKLNGKWVMMKKL